jgi:hypothetical protein
MGRDKLHAHAELYFKQGGASEPEVALVRCGQARAIFKDYGRTPGWFGHLIAPMLLWREASALIALDELMGMPKLYHRPDRRGLLMEYLPATPWPQATPADPTYDRLDELVAAMHERGVAHCDLRGGGNILVGESGQPYIVDFVARIRRGPCWNLPWNWLFRQFVAADRSALIKLRVRHAPHLATTEDRRGLATRGLAERMARAIGQGVRRGVRWLIARGDKSS